MKKLHTALLLSGVAFLAYLVWTVGGRELWQQLRALGWGVLPLVLSEGVANLAHTAGWRRCLSARYRSLPLFLLFRMGMAGFAINYLTPSASLGGEVTKAALLACRQNGPDAVSSVLLDKLCLAFAHLLFAVTGALVVLSFMKLPTALTVAMIVGTVVLTTGIIGFMLLQKHGKLGAAFRWLAAHKVGGRALEKAAQDFSAVDEALKAFYRERPRELVLAVGWHWLGHAMALVQVWFFFHLLSQPVPLTGIVLAGFLCLWFDLLTFAVPLNLGTLEGSRILALKAVGCSALLGMTYGVTLRIALLFWAGFGLVNYASFIWAPGRSKAFALWADRPAELQRQLQSDKSRSAR